MAWHIPLLIFFARILDVSIGTVRIITVMRGHKVVAALLGFTESVVWLLAVSGVLSYINQTVFPQSLFAVFAYGAGFASGTLIGIMIEQRLALGQQMIRAVNITPDIDLGSSMRAEGLAVTVVDGHGATGPVQICFTVVPRRRTQIVIEQILDHCPQAFITIEDLRQSSNALQRLEQSRAPSWLRLTKFR